MQNSLSTTSLPLDPKRSIFFLRPRVFLSDCSRQMIRQVLEVLHSLREMSLNLVGFSPFFSFHITRW